MDSYDIKKELKKQYNASSHRISTVVIPRIHYLMIDGIGNPRVDEFKLKSKALQDVSREIKKKYKAQIQISLSPLEGLWDTYDNSHFDVTRKAMIHFTLMMATLPTLTNQDLLRIQDELSLKDDNPYIYDIYLKDFEEGECVQKLHRGTYESEINTTKEIMEYITVANNKLDGYHHEIYLNDAQKVQPEDLKTIVRYAIKEVEL